MNEMAVDVNERGLRGLVVNDVRGPDFFEEGAWSHTVGYSACRERPGRCCLRVVVSPKSYCNNSMRRAPTLRLARPWGRRENAFADPPVLLTIRNSLKKAKAP